MNIRRISRLVVGFAICLGMVLAACDESAAQPVTPPGMMFNASFEDRADDKPVGWETRTYGGKGDFKHVQGGRSGDWCVMVSSQDGADAGWLTTVPIKPRSQYKLSGWIKTENVAAGSGRGALLNLHNIQPHQTPPITGTKDWTRVEFVFDSRETAAVQINCLLGGWGLSTGKAWFDEASRPDRCDRDQRAYIEVHVRTVYRAPWSLHLRRNMGRNARRPQILFPHHSELPALSPQAGHAQR